MMLTRSWHGFSTRALKEQKHGLKTRATINALFVAIILIAATPFAPAADILTPAPPATPRINGPTIYGERPGRPFLYHIPATGERPMTFVVDGLPNGLKLNDKTGDITGKVDQ